MTKTAKKVPDSHLKLTTLDYETKCTGIINVPTTHGVLKQAADPDILKGRGDNVSAQSSFFANAHNELCANMRPIWGGGGPQPPL